MHEGPGRQVCPKYLHPRVTSTWASKSTTKTPKHMAQSEKCFFRFIQGLCTLWDPAGLSSIHKGWGRGEYQHFLLKTKCITSAHILFAQIPSNGPHLVAKGKLWHVVSYEGSSEPCSGSREEAEHGRTVYNPRHTPGQELQPAWQPQTLRFLHIFTCTEEASIGIK